MYCPTCSFPLSELDWCDNCGWSRPLPLPPDEIIIKEIEVTIAIHKPKLIDKLTGKELQLGTVVKDFRGGSWRLIGFSTPRHINSSGRVIVQDLDTNETSEFFPSVIDAKIEMPEGHDVF